MDLGTGLAVFGGCGMFLGMFLKIYPNKKNKNNENRVKIKKECLKRFEIHDKVIGEMKGDVKNIKENITEIKETLKDIDNKIK